MFLNTSRATLFAAAIFFSLGVVNFASGQDNLPPVQEPIPTGNENANNSQQQGGNVATGDGVVDPTVDNVDIEFSENTRNQGFVGATTANITDTETGFVGAVSEQSGPGLSADASFSSGANDYSPVVPGLARPNTGGGGGVAGGTEIYSSIARRSIRAKLVPSFYAPRPSPVNVSSRFRNRFAQQPGSKLSGKGYTVTVENRTAFIKGSVDSLIDSQRLERQLRLEPGIYKIENRLSVRQNGPVVQPRVVQ